MFNIINPLHPLAIDHGSTPSLHHHTKIIPLHIRSIPSIDIPPFHHTIDVTP